MKILLLPVIRFIISFLRLRWNSSPEDTASQQTGLYGYEVLRFQAWKPMSTCKCLICHLLLVLSVFLLLVLSFSGCIFLWEGVSLYLSLRRCFSQERSLHKEPQKHQACILLNTGLPNTRTQSLWPWGRWPSWGHESPAGWGAGSQHYLNHVD